MPIGARPDEHLSLVPKLARSNVDVKLQKGRVFRVKDSIVECVSKFLATRNSRYDLRTCSFKTLNNVRFLQNLEP